MRKFSSPNIFWREFATSSAVGTGVVDDDYLVRQFGFGECVVQELRDEGEIVAFVVGGENYRVKHGVDAVVVEVAVAVAAYACGHGRGTSLMICPDSAR